MVADIEKTNLGWTTTINAATSRKPEMFDPIFPFWMASIIPAVTIQQAMVVIQTVRPAVHT
jgi:hypothetical protein